MYIKFYNLYMHKTPYTFILIFKHLFFTVWVEDEFYIITEINITEI